MRKRASEFWANEVIKQQQWLADCGGTREGYRLHYGTADDPHRSGDGGDAIYEADIQALQRCQDNFYKALRREQQADARKGRHALPAAAR